ncbi:hypothetical protein NDU88_002419 [Pleurodeles waltl]|uniref:Uncharacterized protein n=1 Tax=Pleurodeles waltl TaxID=8319 RepID=A0AAV7MNQ0_PLEWA|nr:hypothetical protein NDU88_002419 [Pleurodeles waltl]
MPGGRSSHKTTGKPARQLLLSKALLQKKRDSPADSDAALYHISRDGEPGPGALNGSYPSGNFSSWP